jgi:YD repeat-containing protein
MGRRLKKKFTYHNGSNTDVTTYKYHYIGGQITEIEIDSIRNPGEGQTVLRDEEMKIHLGANGQPISYEWVKHVGGNTTQATYYYHYDIHGNVLKITDSSENTKITYTYDVLGKILTETNPDSILNFFTFRGASQTIWDSEVGMYYSGGYYRPDTGTALQGTGAPVLTNPASSAMLNAVAQATAANTQLAAHAMVSAATAGSSSGGAPGGFSPPPGPSDGIAQAGRKGPPPTTASIEPTLDVGGGNGSLPTAGSSVIFGFRGIKYIDPNQVYPQPHPPVIYPIDDGTGNPGGGEVGDDPPPGSGGRGGRLKGVPEEAWEEAMWWYINLLASQLGVDPRAIGQMYNDGVDLSSIDLNNPDAKKFWVAWGEVNGQMWLFGYQIGDSCPRLFWGPQAGVKAEDDPETIAAGRSPGAIFAGGFGTKFINSWLDAPLTEGGQPIKIECMNTTGCNIGILIWAYSEHSTQTEVNSPVASQNLLIINISACNKISFGQQNFAGSSMKKEIIPGNYPFVLGNCVVIKENVIDGTISANQYGMFVASRVSFERGGKTFWTYSGKYSRVWLQKMKYGSLTDVPEFLRDILP